MTRSHLGFQGGVEVAGNAVDLHDQLLLLLLDPDNKCQFVEIVSKTMKSNVAVLQHRCHDTRFVTGVVFLIDTNCPGDIENHGRPRVVRACRSWTRHVLILSSPRDQVSCCVMGHGRL